MKKETSANSEECHNITVDAFVIHEMSQKMKDLAHIANLASASGVSYGYYMADRRSKEGVVCTRRK